MAKISAPAPGYNGISAGVKFEGGVGHTDNENVITWFRRKGYTVEDEAPPEVTDPPAAPPPPPVTETTPPAGEAGSPLMEVVTEDDPDGLPWAEQPAAPPSDSGTPVPPPPPPQPDPLDKLTTAELKEYAAEKKIDISGISAKSNILAKIKEATKGGT